MRAGSLGEKRARVGVTLASGVSQSGSVTAQREGETRTLRRSVAHIQGGVDGGQGRGGIYTDGRQ